MKRVGEGFGSEVNKNRVTTGLPGRSHVNWFLGEAS